MKGRKERRKGGRKEGSEGGREKGGKGGREEGRKGGREEGRRARRGKKERLYVKGRSLDGEKKEKFKRRKWETEDEEISLYSSPPSLQLA